MASGRLAAARRRAWLQRRWSDGATSHRQTRRRPGTASRPGLSELVRDDGRQDRKRIRDAPTQSMSPMPGWSAGTLPTPMRELRRVRVRASLMTGQPVSGACNASAGTQRSRPMRMDSWDTTPPVAQVAELVEQGAGPQVRVIGQALRAIRREHLERIQKAPWCADPGLASRQAGPDGLSVLSQMPGDRGDRPTLATQCVHVDVVLPCEHER